MIRRVGSLLFMVALYYAIQLATLLLAVYPHLSLPEAWTAPGGWVRAFDHHFWQLVLALAAIGILSRGRWQEWGLNLQNRAGSLRILRRFCLYYGVYFVGVGFLIQLLLFPSPTLDHPLTTGNVIGRLAFGFLFVGLSEEILFRGLIQTHLARSWRGVWRWRGWELPVAGLLSTLIFVVAHIGFSVAPLAVTHLNPAQLLLALVLGLYYAAVYHRTRSLLNPILAHNFSDGTLWIQEYLLVWLKA
jgi:uncharacterized protein